MDQYLRAHERAEKIIADDTADLGVRVDAIAILLQYPMSSGLRMDLRRMYIDFTDLIKSGEVTA